MKKLCVFAPLRAAIISYAICFLFLAILLISCNDSSNSSSTNTSTSATTTTENTAYPEGKKIYQKTCIVCHQSTGEGMMGTYPPLANSDYLLANKYRGMHQVLKGSSTAITVNGNTYNGVMPPQSLSDEEVAQVLNYIYHSWGNNAFTLSASDVKSVRDSLK